jgi:hypothetical protein
MTRIVIPGMKTRKKGAIVNIGSAAATVAPSGPLYAIYAGTKVRNRPLQTGLDHLLLLPFSVPSDVRALGCLFFATKARDSTVEP